jgi:hypothetical protein
MSCHGVGGKNGISHQLASIYNSETNFSLGQYPKTIGSYWPYATTLYDYIYRAMPLTAPGSLSANQVYSLTAYLLHINGIVHKNTVMNSETLPKVIMPAHVRFYRSVL